MKNQKSQSSNSDNGMLFSHKKEENPVFYDNMDGPWGHYAKWN